jgi:hypothetical protein
LPAGAHPVGVRRLGEPMGDSPAVVEAHNTEQANGPT